MSLTRFVRPVVTVDEHEVARAVAQRMRDEHVGAVVVARDGRPIGILTDRDLTVRVLAEERRGGETRIGDIVTYDPLVVSASEDIETALTRMRKHGVRRLPIVDEAGKLIGIVTSDDMLMLLGRELSSLSEAIEMGADACDSR